MANSLPTRIDKTLEWLTLSRNIWKKKCKETKLLLKRQTFTVKRLKSNRNDWRLSSINLKQELSKSEEKNSILQQRIDALESQIENYKKDIEALKKKSFRIMKA